MGFGTADLGRTHISNYTQSITYAFCPPTSGNHYNIAGQAPLPRTADGFYPPSTTLKPGNWIHNLEHGYAVILYKGTPAADTIDSIRTVLSTAAGDSFAKVTCGLPNRVIAVRFDDMDTPFAALAWDRALLLPQWDPTAAKTFVEQWQDSPAIPENPKLGAGIC